MAEGMPSCSRSLWQHAPAGGRGSRPRGRTFHAKRSQAALRASGCSAGSGSGGASAPSNAAACVRGPGEGVGMGKHHEGGGGQGAG